MTRTRTLLISSCLAALSFAACAATGGRAGADLQNPYTASRYGDELADSMANLIISNDPVVNRPDGKRIIQEHIHKGKDIAAAAREVLSRGMNGALLPLSQSTQGYVDYVDDHVYFSTDFVTDPGITLHAYLTTIVDPRTGRFPDKTAIDLGELPSSFGPQTFSVPHQSKPDEYRTLVLWDTTLGRLTSFAQLSKTSGHVQ